MNVYDFDKTICKYDSSYLFIKYVLRKYPRLVFVNSSEIFSSCLSYVQNKDISRVKESLFSFLSYISEPDKLVNDFWSESEKFIQKWYLNQRKNDDVVISASPYFLIEPIANKFGFKLIATDMDKFSGRIMGINTKGQQKVVRFKEIFGDTAIDEFYSDSLTDQPLAEISKCPYLVDDGNIIPWPIY